MFAQKIEDDAVEPGGVGGEISAMAALGLDVRLKIRGAAEKGAEGLVEDAGAVAAADDEVVLARDDEGRTLETGCIGGEKAGRDGQQLADSERLLGGLGEGGYGAVVRPCLEELLDVAENVGRGDVTAVEDGEGVRPLQACDPRREPFERQLAVGPVERVAGENGGVGDGRVICYQCVGGEGAKGVTDEHEIFRLANRRVFAMAHGFCQGGKNGNSDGDLIIIA